MNLMRTDYVLGIIGMLFVFLVMFFATGILGRGWFLWGKDSRDENQRR